MFEQFETDANLEQEGVYVDYGDFRVKIAFAGGANKKFLSYSEQKTKPFRRAIASGSFSEERAKPLMYDIYAETIVLDWEILDGEDDEGEAKWISGIPQKDGSVAEVTKENIVAVFKQLPALFNDIQETSKSISAFRKEDLEEDSKNL